MLVGDMNHKVSVIVRLFARHLSQLDDWKNRQDRHGHHTVCQ